MLVRQVSLFFGLGFFLLSTQLFAGPTMTESERRSAIGTVNWQNVTFGFEAESRDRDGGSGMVSGMQRQLSGGQGPTVPGMNSTYMSTDWYQESTGNLEFHSKVINRQVVFKAMRDFTQQMKSSGRETAVRGYHLHVRIPVSEVNVPEGELKSWFARVGDSIAAVRAAQYRGFFSTNVWSQVRQQPGGGNIYDRGTIRVQRMGNEWDIEFRGFVRSIDALEKHVDLVFAGMKNPEMIRGMEHWHKAVFEQTYKLGDMVDLWARKNNRSPLSGEQKQTLSRIAESKTTDASMMFPVMNYEIMPWLTPEERRKIRMANNTFYKKMYERLLAGGQSAAEGSFYPGIKRWGQNSGIEQALRKGIILKPGEWGAEAVTATLVQKLANNSSKSWAKKILAEIPVDAVADKAAGVLTAEEAESLKTALPSNRQSRFSERFGNRFGSLCAAVQRHP